MRGVIKLLAMQQEENNKTFDIGTNVTMFSLHLHLDSEMPEDKLHTMLM